MTYGAEPFLRSRQLCSYSGTSQYFIEPECSLQCSQEPSTGPYPEPHRSSPYHLILSKIHFCPKRTCPIYTSDIPCPKSHIRFLSLRSFIQRIPPRPRLFVIFRNKLIFYSEESLVPCLNITPKLEDHPLSAFRDCLLNIFAATLHIWTPSPSSAT
jgi:hypothetical protein